MNDFHTMLQEMSSLLTVWVMQSGVNILQAIAVLVLGWWGARKLAMLVRKGLGAYRVDSLQIGFLTAVVQYSTVAAVVLIAAAKLGINIASLIAVFGAAALAIGLAVKDNLSNFSSGMLLVFFRPFTAGDYVELEGVAGTVQATNLFSTILHTVDNKKIVIPNRIVMDSIITNVTGNATRRIDLAVGIGYADDVALAKQVIMQLLVENERLLKIPEPLVAVESLGDSSVNLTVRAWVPTGQYLSTKFMLLEDIKQVLDTHGISIPFPQMDVHMDTAP
ncbi:MAG: mechanosensitive ion channel [Desulfovibrionales bacterium]|nr:mechanosensitive ion channel [Desulfovibrionales bacterium]